MPSGMKTTRVEAACRADASTHFHADSPLVFAHFANPVCGLLQRLNAVILQAVFATETIVSSVVREGYFLRLFFWIDVVAALSMALDSPFVTNKMTHNPDGHGSGAGLPTLSRGKASGLIQRLRSIMRVTRILRLMRLVQLYGRYQVQSVELASCDCQSGDMRPWCICQLSWTDWC